MRLTVSILVLLLSNSLPAQDPVRETITTGNNDRFVLHIASIPSQESDESKGFFEKVFNVIVGNEPVIYNNPVNVYANGARDLLIVNQGDGSILHYLDGKTTKLPVFRKNISFFPSLVGICSIGDKGILVTDSGLDEVLLFSPDGKQFSIFIDSLKLKRPTGIAYSALKDEIWVVETGEHHISVFNSKGDRKKTVGKRGDGPLEFNYPTYIWIDGSGKVYIVDSMNFRIQILSANGEYISSFGKQGDVTGSFARPRGVATDSYGNIFVVDALFNAIQIFDISGRLLYYFGTQGRGEFQFWMPSGIFIDKNDLIYISDSYNGRIQIFQLKKNNQHENR